MSEVTENKYGRTAKKMVIKRVKNGMLIDTRYLFLLHLKADLNTFVNNIESPDRMVDINS